MRGRLKPDGHTSLSPYLMAENAQRGVDFVRAVFGARELRRFDGPHGGIMHTELLIDDTVVMPADAGAPWPAFPSRPAGSACRSRGRARAIPTGAAG